MNLLRKLTSAPATAHRAERGEVLVAAPHVDTFGADWVLNKRRRIVGVPRAGWAIGRRCDSRGMAKRCQIVLVWQTILVPFVIRGIRQSR